MRSVGCVLVTAINEMSLGPWPERPAAAEMRSRIDARLEAIVMRELRRETILRCANDAGKPILSLPKGRPRHIIITSSLWGALVRWGRRRPRRVRRSSKRPNRLIQSFLPPDTTDR